MKWKVFIVVLLCSGVQAQERILFTSGDLGYKCFRIPALVQWEGGELFAFAEGRKSNCADFGNVDILMRRSVDSGRTWSPVRVLVDNGDLQAGNSTPIIDRLDPRFPEGRLLLFYNTGTATEYDTRMGLGKRRGYVIASSDHGEHWSAPQEILSENPDLDQRTWAFAPGHGMQFNEGIYAGRLFVPANRSVGGPKEGFRDYQAYGLYSDDHGKTWKESKDLGVPSSNESMGVPLGAESLLLTVRIQNQGVKRKQMAISRNGGERWDTTWLAPALTTPMCQSSILSHQGQFYLLGPADTNARKQLTLWSSQDGLEWKVTRELYPGSCAYSDMASFSDQGLYIFYERNDYTEIVFDRVIFEVAN